MPGLWQNANSWVMWSEKVSSLEEAKLKAKLKAVVEFATPRGKKDVEHSCGMQAITTISIETPIHDLTKKEVLYRVAWGNQHLQAHQSLEVALVLDAALMAPNFGLSFTLLMDASMDTSVLGVGAVLSQLDLKERECLIAYHSRKLVPCEKNNPTVEKECRAIV